jgi:hypothetical protein
VRGGVKFVYLSTATQCGSPLYTLIKPANHFQDDALVGSQDQVIPVTDITEIPFPVILFTYI